MKSLYETKLNEVITLLEQEPDYWKVLQKYRKICYVSA